MGWAEDSISAAGEGLGGGGGEGGMSGRALGKHCDYFLTESHVEFSFFHFKLMWNEFVKVKNSCIKKEHRLKKSPQIILNVRAPVCSDFDAKWQFES